MLSRSVSQMIRPLGVEYRRRWGGNMVDWTFIGVMMLGGILVYLLSKHEGSDE